MKHFQAANKLILEGFGDVFGECWEFWEGFGNVLGLMLAKVSEPTNLEKDFLWVEVIWYLPSHNHVHLAVGLWSRTWLSYSTQVEVVDPDEETFRKRRETPQW